MQKFPLNCAGQEGGLVTVYRVCWHDWKIELRSLQDFAQPGAVRSCLKKIRVHAQMYCLSLKFHTDVMDL